MNWLLERLGYREREYRGDDFSVRIEPIVREGVSVIHTRHGASLNLRGERIGRKRDAIEVHIPPDVEAAQLPQIVRDLETAFGALRYGYVIARKTVVEIVPESERRDAIAKLREMGYEIEVSADGKQIRQKWRAGAPRDIEAQRRTAPGMISLLQSVHGTRPSLEILAKSNEF
jgi:hypothetical protein